MRVYLKLNRPLGLLLPIAFLFAGGMSGCSSDSEASVPPPETAPMVLVARAAAGSVGEAVEFTGKVEAVKSASLRPRVTGYVQSVNLKAGAMVNKGDVLFVLDSRDFRAALAKAEATAAASQARALLAVAELERAKKLFQDQAISRKDFEERESGSQERLATAKANDAAVQEARLNQEYTVIRAPFSGRVGRAEVTEGNLVSPQSVLTTIVAVDPVYVSFDVDEATFVRLSPAVYAHPGRLSIDVGLAHEDGFPWKAKLESVDNQLSAATGSIRMRAELGNADAKFTPGLYAKVRWSLPANTGDAVLVKETALGTDLDKRFVLVVGKDKKVEYRTVETGNTFSGWKVVTSGLRQGEAVIVEGLQKVRPGMVVQTKETQLAPPGMLTTHLK
jgi:multidrug efflux system membrane fusion protein